MKKIWIFLIICFWGAINVYSADFWEPIGNIGGTAFTFALDSAGNLFAGTYNSIYKSTDDGRTWIKKQIGGSYSNFIAIAVTPNGVLYSGSHTANMYKSTNDGENWTSFNSIGFQDQRPIIALQNGDVIACPYFRGMFRTTDEGKTWSKDTVGLDAKHIWSFAVAKNGDILAGTDNYIFQSTDNGKTWFKMNFVADCPKVTSLLILKNGDILAGSEKMKCGIFISKDNGSTWNPAFEGLDLNWYSYVFQMVESVNGHIFAVTNEDAVYVSKDKGKTATKLSTGFQSDAFYWGILITPGGYLLAGTIKGIYRSTELVTGISEEFDNTEGETIISPNPVNNILRITNMNKFAVSASSGRTEVRILNLLGEPVITHEITNLSNPELDISGLTSGIYIFRFGTFSKIFVKN